MGESRCGSASTDWVENREQGTMGCLHVPNLGGLPEGEFRVPKDDRDGNSTITWWRDREDDAFGTNE